MHEKKPDEEKTKVYLAGTPEDISQWRRGLIPFLPSSVEFFCPYVMEHVAHIADRCDEIRQDCDVVVYWITPGHESILIIAQLISDINQRQGSVIFGFGAVVPGEPAFTEKQEQELRRIGMMVTSSGNMWLPDLKEILEALTRGLSMVPTVSEIKS